MPRDKAAPGLTRRSFLKTVGAGGVAAGVWNKAPDANAQNAAQARRALDDNLCRCGTYVRVLEAALTAKGMARG